MSKDYQSSELAKSIQPGRYRHFKGNEYTVLGVAFHSETQEELVVYHRVGESQLWVRPLQMFVENVDKPDYNYKGPRFTYIGE